MFCRTNTHSLFNSYPFVKTAVTWSDVWDAIKTYGPPVLGYTGLGGVLGAGVGAILYSNLSPEERRKNVIRTALLGALIGGIGRGVLGGVLPDLLYKQPPPSKPSLELPPLEYSVPPEYIPPFPDRPPGIVYT